MCTDSSSASIECSSSRSSRARSDFTPPSLGTRKVRSSSSRVEPARSRAAASSSRTPVNRSRTWLPGIWRLSSPGAALGDQAALVEHRDPVGELVGFLEVLGGEEDGHAVGHQLADDVPHRAAAARVQSGRRLVQEDDLRAGRPASWPGPASGASRRSRSPPSCRADSAQVEPLQQPGDHPPGLGAAQMVQVRHQLQVLLPGQQLVHRGELAGDPDGRAHRPGLGRHVMPGRPAPSRCRPSTTWSARSPWSSCPPRSGRAGKRPCPRRHRRSMPSSTTLSPYAFRSPETAIAEVLMRPLSAPAPDTAPDTPLTPPLTWRSTSLRQARTLNRLLGRLTGPRQRRGDPVPPGQ